VTSEPNTGAPRATRVLIVEDHSILTQTLHLTLRLEGMEPYVAAGLDDATVLDEARRVRPDVVLLDLNLGTGRNAVAMISPLVASGARVLVLTGSSDQGLYGAALDAGAAAILHKGESLEQLCQGIRDVVNGGAPMRPSRRDELLARGRERLALQACMDTLSPREREVLAALMEGTSAETIASSWHVSVATVRSHIRSILHKLNVPSQLAAVAIAHQVEELD
jgi:two-component system nitrate/nitrite response regulator NarL